MRSTDIPTIPASEITPKSTFLSRRTFMAGAAATGISAFGVNPTYAAASVAPLPFTVNPSFMPSDKPTPRDLSTTYNNYYEFGTSKGEPARMAGTLVTRPWTVEIGGEVHKPRTLGIDDLIALGLEERVYRMRCVEAWSMVIPWVGLPLSRLTALVEPTANAKYLMFTSVARPDEMPGIRSRILDWPYREGLRIDEAMHPLTLLALGVYGEVMPNQNGAPVRLVVPWKYGFKGAKSLVRIDFVEKQPVTAWMKAGPDEYGFYANVNPAVDHPRWSQKRERLLPSLFSSRITEPFNGYADQVASLYSGMDLQVNF